MRGNTSQAGDDHADVNYTHRCQSRIPGGVALRKLVETQGWWASTGPMLGQEVRTIQSRPR